MLIKANFIIELEHRAYFVQCRDSLILAASKKGNVTIVDLNDSSRLKFNFERNITDISFSKSQNRISIIEEETGNMSFVDFGGKLISTEKSPRFKTNYPETCHYSFLACYFDQCEQYLWCASLVDDLKVEIQLRSSDGHSIIDKIIIEDPFGDSFFSFHPTNNPDFVSLWIAAGQDGQKIHWLKIIDNKLILEKDFTFSETTPPVFSSNGTNFLILEDYTISHYNYPTSKIGSCEGDFEDEDDSFGYYICYLNENFALVCSNSGRNFLLNLHKMKITGEIIIEKHEPKPTSYYYPSLQDEEICTDLLFFEKLGNNICFVYRRDKNLDSKSWKDSLLIIPAENIISKFN